MARATGSGAYISFKGTAIQTDFTEWTDQGEMGLAESTAGADTYQSNLSTYRKGGGTLKAYYAGGTAATDIYNLLIEGASGTLIIGPYGTATGSPKTTVTSAVVNKRDRTIAFDKSMEITAEFTFNSAPSDTAF